MTPQELKNSILQLAIQGRLVEQRPEEGTAEELYRQIQAEKQSLIKAGKIKKEKPLPEITDDEKPFDIPESWKWVRLSDVCSLISDGTHKTPHYVDKGVPFISVKDISTGYLDLSDTKFISDEEHNQLIQRCKPEQNDILICRIGTLGKALKINVPVEFSIFVSLGLIKLIDSSIADYVALSINSGYGFSWIQKVKVGGGTHTYKINLDDLRQYPFPLPPLAEQKRIVAKIEELLPLIDRYEEAWTKLEDFNKRFPGDMQKSLLQMAIQGKLVEQRHEELPIDLLNCNKVETEDIEFDLPDTWKISSIESITNSIPSKQYQVKESEVLKEGSYPVISQSKEYSIGFSNDVIKLYKHKNPVIIFGDHTTEVKYINFDFIVGADGVKIFEPIESVIYSKYLFYVLLLYTIGLEKVGGYSRHYKFIKNKPIALPPLAEQKRIVAKLEELLPLCERLK